MIGAVVPAYNREDNLELLLASLEHQSSSDFHVVVADDGSTDGTAALVARLARRPVWRDRLTRVSCGPNQGVRTGRARNIGAANLSPGTQATYRDLLDHLDAQGIPWGTLVIDARWFLAGGLKNVDTGRWPDLRGFIDFQHRQGRKVLLWWGPWDPEGVPAEECIRYLPGAQPGRQNRPGRMAKFGAPEPGRKLTVDITLPAVRQRIRDQVSLLLGPSGFDADGLKIDHVSAAPGVYGMAFPDESGRLFGIEAVRSCLHLLYETAKQVKPDALVIGQSPDPYLADVQDMLRLGDVYSVRADSVAEEMTFRAAMVRQVDPSWPIDTDGWPMPSLAAFREYIDTQPSLGVPSLYYATHLDTTGEAPTQDDYARIRKAWSAACS